MAAPAGRVWNCELGRNYERFGNLEFRRLKNYRAVAMACHGCYNRNMTFADFLYSLIIVLLGTIGYFVKRIFDKTDEIGIDVSDMKPKVKILWEREFATGSSPLTLNERGKQILEESGIKEIVDAEAEDLLQKLADLKPLNAYQVQECSVNVVRVLAENPSVLAKLQEGAYKTGVNVDSVLFVGAIYFRDLALPKYNFKLEDIDEEKKEE
jgi:hypothetical protein